jgi:uncharacterized protein DUF6790
LLWLLVVDAGAIRIFAFVGYAFAADQVAASIGWPAGSGFRPEVGFANLAFCLLGTLCLRIRRRFWLATAPQTIRRGG